MEQPLVSIALCTYNGEKFLREQLDSLVHQTYSNLEIVAVDDCSKDSTLTILKEYEQQFPFFKVYQNETNLGFVKNFEKAVNLTKAEFIAFCDQDDIWHHDKIRLQMENLADNILIYHDSEFINADGSSMNKKLSDIMNLYRGNQPEAFLFFNCMSAHSMLVKRELLNKALPFDKTFFHDWWMAYVGTNIGKIDYIDQCLVKYRQHEKNDTNILRLKKESTDSYADANRMKRLQNQLLWLQHCKNFSHNKNQYFIDKIYKLFKLRLENYFAFELTNLMLKYRKPLFAIQKKSKVSKINFIRKMFIGVKFDKKKYS